MRFTSTFLLALPAIAIAEEQIPLGDRLKGFWNKAVDAVTSAVPAAVPSSPVEAASAKVAGKVTHQLTLDNWKDTLTVDPTTSAPATKDWMVFVTGGNVTCFGFCGNATKAWNASVPLIAASPKAPSLAVLDCEAEPILCNSWSVGPPAIYYFQIPKPLADQSAPAATARYIPLNRTSVTAKQISALALNNEYEQTEPYEGPWQPFNGLLAQYGLALPAGYIFWGFSKMPSWLPMILISFMSRSFMGRRMPQNNAPAPAQ